MSSRRLLDRAPVFLLILLVVAVFRQVVGDDFIHFDDNIHIYNNPLLAPISPSHLKDMWREPYANLYIPLSYTVFAALSLLAHTSQPVPNLTDTGRLLDPRIFHLASVVMHTVNTVLVYLLLRRLVQKSWPAFFGAALWAVHPLQVESVAWASELRGLLSAFFALLALLQVARDPVDTAGDARWVDRAWIATIVLSVCSMLCKPSGVVVPFLAFVVEVVILKRDARRSLIRNAVLLALLAPFVFVTTNAQSDVLPGPFPPVPVLQRPLIALDALGFYLRKLVLWPPFVIDYGRTPYIVLQRHLYVLTSAITVAVTAFALIVRKRRPWIATGLLIMTIDLLPVLGLTMFIFQYYSTVADRYMYLALLGPAYAVASGLAACSKPWIYALPTAAAAVCIAVSVGYIGYWQNSDTLFTYVVQKNPRSINGWEILGTDARHRGDLNAMLGFYLHEIPIAPDDYRGYNDAGTSYVMQNEDAKAIPYFIKALSIRPKYADIYYNLGEAYRGLNRYDDARQQYEKGMALAPKDPKMYVGISKTYRAQGDFAQAESWCQTALKHDPNFTDAYAGLAEMYSAQRRYPEALVMFQNAQRCDPSTAAYSYDVGVIDDQLGRIPDAVKAYSYAVTYAPTLKQPHVALGVDLARLADYTDAIPQFQEALKIDPTDVNAQGDLALAQSYLARQAPAEH